MKKEYVYVSKEEYTETNNENIRLTAENIELNLELQRKDNNWNELKEFILNHYIVGHTVQNGSLDMIINKMKEIENGK